MPDKRFVESLLEYVTPLRFCVERNLEPIFRRLKGNRMQLSLVVESEFEFFSTSFQAKAESNGARWRK